MVIKNAAVFLDGTFQKTNVRIENGKIQSVSESYAENEEILEADGMYLLPGMIDIHTHGCVGEDFSVSDTQGIKKMLRHYAANGVTSVLATTMTEEPEKLLRAMGAIKKAMDAQTAHTPETAEESRLRGIYMEGPFFGDAKRGAHDAAWLRGVDETMFQKLDTQSGHAIRVVAIDPMLSGALAFIKKYRETKRFSLAHTTCDYETAVLACEAGATQVTHLFNAMNGLHHRAPGLIGAVGDLPMKAELICDGIHIHPSVVRLMFRAIPEKLILISDSMQAAGLSDGIYQLGGRRVIVEGQRAAQEDGTIAGSVIHVFEAVRRAVSFGVAPELVVASATSIPARAVGLEQEIGSIVPGRDADCLLVSGDWSLQKVYLRGKQICEDAH